MHKGRIEAFSDGVLAVIITIMVLELHVPHGTDLTALQPLIPIFLSYLLSFVFLGIYWNNHHHLFQAVEHVNGRVLWANLHLLFWLSLIPLVTSWIGESSLAPWPVALYGVVLWMSAIAYYFLASALLALHGDDSVLAAALGRKSKEILSLVIYTAAVVLAFIVPPVSIALYVVVAIMWLIPDMRIEKTLAH